MSEETIDPINPIAWYMQDRYVAWSTEPATERIEISTNDLFIEINELLQNAEISPGDLSRWLINNKYITNGNNDWILYKKAAN
jgi:hypothetical protein